MYNGDDDPRKEFIYFFLEALRWSRRRRTNSKKVKSTRKEEDEIFKFRVYIMCIWGADVSGILWVKVADT